MTKLKTRCSKCLYSKKKAVEDPCDKCSEIQNPVYKCQNFFKDDSKD